MSKKDVIFKSIVLFDLFGCTVMGIWAYGQTKYYQGRADARTEIMEEVARLKKQFEQQNKR